MSLRAQTFNRSGFTLVEVLVSLACMALCFVALWALHYSSLKTDIRTDLQTGAIASANSQADFLRALAFSDPLLSDGAHPANPNTPNPANDPPLPTSFTRSYSVATDGTFSWRKNITVTVTWQEKTGAFGGIKTTVPHNVQLAFIITDYR